jgi:hypothetical protein
MSGENEALVTDLEKDTGDGQSRQRSTIAFAYLDLKSATEIAQAIHSNVGLGECAEDQLAAWTNQSPKSSGFRLQLTTARLFNLIDGGGSALRLTDLGRMLVDPSQMRDAKARAFLTVPLYRTVFDKYRGGVLPPAAALERDFVSLGVAEKQKERARQVFERSAEQAGFFESGRNRLVMPAVAVKPDFAPPPPQHDDGANQERGKKSGSGGGDIGDHDPLILGLFQKLPEPDADWPAKDRLKWLQTAANIFDLVYKGEGGIVVSLARADRSPRHDE